MVVLLTQDLEPIIHVARSPFLNTQEPEYFAVLSKDASVSDQGVYKHLELEYFAIHMKAAFIFAHCDGGMNRVEIFRCLY